MALETTGSGRWWTGALRGLSLVADLAVEEEVQSLRSH